MKTNDRKSILYPIKTKNKPDDDYLDNRWMIEKNVPEHKFYKTINYIWNNNSKFNMKLVKNINCYS